MTAALKYISQMTQKAFELRMRRAALRITARQHFFPHHA
jgi:hypothetical protein